MLLISLTTIPERFNTTLPRTLDSIKNIGHKILLNIPVEYKKWGKEFIIPDHLSKNIQIIIHRTKDWGPATKLLGALEYIEKNELDIDHVMTIDDDVIYPDNYTQPFLSSGAKYPNYMVCNGGLVLHHYPYENGDNGLIYHNKEGFVDVPFGWTMAIYPILFLDKHFLSDAFIETLPREIFHDDDTYFGIILGIMGIPVYSMNVRQTCYSIATSSGVVQQMSEDRQINSMKLFQYAVSKGYLPNKYRLHKISCQSKNASDIPDNYS